MKLCFPESVLNQHLIVLGKTGAGKSSALRHVVEHLLRHKKRVCIIDIKGDWWGLKSSADGKSAGFPVVAFGDFREPKAQDVPINAHSGGHVAELITSGNRPCIIGFRGWMPGQITDFWLEFAPKLFNANEGELFVVISECHNFAPKGKVLDPKAGKVLHWTNRLLSEGRGLGMTFLLDSQRPQKVHNDTLTSCETLVAMRVTHASDRGAIKDWIDGCGDKSTGTEVLNTVAGMARGEGWVWSPEIGFGPQRIQFPFFETFDSFAPAQLQKTVSQSGWSAVDLDAVKEKLAAVIEEAKENDPAALKARIRQLEQDAKRTAPAPNVDVNAFIKERIIKGELYTDAAVKESLRLKDDLWTKAVGEYRQSLSKAVGSVSFVEPEPLSLEIIAVGNSQITLPPAPNGVVRRDVYVTPRYSATPAVKVASIPNSEITGPMQRILDAIAWMESIGIQEPKQVAVAFLAGYAVDGGGYCNPRGALRVAGLIEYRGDGLSLTAEGRRLARAPEAPLVTEELHRKVLGKLPGPEQKILSVLLKSYPNALTNEEVAGKAGYEPDGGGYCNPRGRLKTLGLVDYPQKGMVRAADLLFI
jgi:uncharacterized protein